MDVHHVGAANLLPHLADGLQERLGFDVAYRSADLGDYDVRFACTAQPVNIFLYFVGDMRDDLDGTAQEFSFPLPQEDRPVNLPGSDRGIDGEVFVGKPLVMAQIQVRFGSVVGDEDLSVLVGVHGARVYVQVGIKLLERYLIAPLLKKPSQGSRSNSLSQAGNHAACNKNILDRHTHSSLVMSDTLVRESRPCFPIKMYFTTCDDSSQGKAE
ncbi:hypothetical protein SDC9_56553 [bioreactor metagenome]|uniref:Uncharacterized protein n=1 Tax=bioreactor metagenome TaxID=1076179 RepID=A0A644X240_9ZZZZ